MKKVYNIPNTTTVAFRAGFVCNTASPAQSQGTGIGGNTNLDMGGQGDNIDPM